MSRRDEFINMLAPYALAASERTGLDPRLIIAQAAQETGWGRSAPNNNFFGIKSHGKAGGSTQNTFEYVNGRRVNQRDSFRTYDSPGASVDGYVEFLQANPRYRDMLAAPDLGSQLEALGRSGYATDPNYARSVGQIASSIDLEGFTPRNPAPMQNAQMTAAAAPMPAARPQAPSRAPTAEEIFAGIDPGRATPPLSAPQQPMMTAAQQPAATMPPMGAPVAPSMTSGAGLADLFAAAAPALAAMLPQRQRAEQEAAEERARRRRLALFGAGGPTDIYG